MPKVIDEIRSVNRNFMEAFSRGDAAAIAELYTGDARLMPPDTPMMTGPDAIRTFWQGAMNNGIKEAKLETVEVQAHGDLACEVGKYTLTIEPPSGAKMTVGGKYLVEWKKTAGHWKLRADIWNGTPGAN